MICKHHYTQTNDFHILLDNTTQDIENRQNYVEVFQSTLAASANMHNTK